jgi:hypothetical protein
MLVTRYLGASIDAVLPAASDAAVAGRLAGRRPTGYLTAGQRRRGVGALTAGNSPRVRARMQGAGY